jgi:hypothetical protein
MIYADYALIACFVLSAVMVDGRNAIISLFAFLLSIQFFYMPISPSNTHLATAFIYALSVIPASLKQKRYIFLISAFQYIMAVDAYASPYNETLLFMAYPYVSFALNLLLLSNLWNKENINATQTDRFFGIFRRWSAIISRMDKH